MSNALYGEDKGLWDAIYHGLDPRVQADLQDNNAYWAQYQDTHLSKAANSAYEGFLKSYGQSLGAVSYTHLDVYKRQLWSRPWDTTLVILEF